MPQLTEAQIQIANTLEDRKLAALSLGSRPVNVFGGGVDETSAEDQIKNPVRAIAIDTRDPTKVVVQYYELNAFITSVRYQQNKPYISDPIAGDQYKIIQVDLALKLRERCYGYQPDAQAEEPADIQHARATVIEINTILAACEERMGNLNRNAVLNAPALDTNTMVQNLNALVNELVQGTHANVPRSDINAPNGVVEKLLAFILRGLMDRDLEARVFASMAMKNRIRHQFHRQIHISMNLLSLPQFADQTRRELRALELALTAMDPAIEWDTARPEQINPSLIAFARSPIFFPESAEDFMLLSTAMANVFVNLPTALLRGSIVIASAITGLPVDRLRPQYMRALNRPRLMPFALTDGLAHAIAVNLVLMPFASPHLIHRSLTSSRSILPAFFNFQVGVRIGASLAGVLGLLVAMRLAVTILSALDLWPHEEDNDYDDGLQDPIPHVEQAIVPIPHAINRIGLDWLIQNLLQFNNNVQHLLMTLAAQPDGRNVLDGMGIVSQRAIIPYVSNNEFVRNLIRFSDAGNRNAAVAQRQHNYERAIIVRPQPGPMIPYVARNRVMRESEALEALFYLLLRHIANLYPQRPICAISQDIIQNPIQVLSRSGGPQYYEFEEFFRYVAHQVAWGATPVVDVNTRAVIIDVNEAQILRILHYPDSLMPENAEALDALRTRMQAFNTQQMRADGNARRRDDNVNPNPNNDGQAFLIFQPMIGEPLQISWRAAILLGMVLIPLWLYRGILRQHRNGFSHLTTEELAVAAVNVMQEALSDALWQGIFIGGLALYCSNILRTRVWRNITNIVENIRPELQQLQEMLTPAWQNIQNVRNVVQENAAQQPAIANQNRRRIGWRDCSIQ